jgi:hypothetical protein
MLAKPFARIGSETIGGDAEAGGFPTPTPHRRAQTVRFSMRRLGIQNQIERALRQGYCCLHTPVKT